MPRIIRRAIYTPPNVANGRIEDTVRFEDVVVPTEEELRRAQEQEFIQHITAQPVDVLNTMGRFSELMTQATYPPLVFNTIPRPEMNYAQIREMQAQRARAQLEAYRSRFAATLIPNFEFTTTGEPSIMATKPKKLTASEESRLNHTLTNIQRGYRDGGKGRARLRMRENMCMTDFFRQHPYKLSEKWEPRPEWKDLGTKLRNALREEKLHEAAGIIILLRLEYSSYPKDKIINFIQKKLNNEAALAGRDFDSESINSRTNEIDEKAADTIITWREEEWWAVHVQKHPHHFLTAANTTEGHVSYFENYSRLYEGRRSTLKPGRYLMKYLNKVLTEGQIKAWADKQIAHMNKWAGRLSFIEPTDKKGWLDVYANGPGSCMQGASQVAIYAHDKSVLRLAHWTQEGAITCRAIVREDTKQWLRIYPAVQESQYSVNFHNALTAAGYKKQGNLLGVLLDAVIYKSAGHYVMPYLDNGDGPAPYVKVTKDEASGKEYILVGKSSDGGKNAQTTNGYLQLPSSEFPHSCRRCSIGLRTTEIWRRNDSSDIYCKSCFHLLHVEAFTAKDHHEYITRADAVQCGDHWYLATQSVFTAFDLKHCPSCAKLSHGKDLFLEPHGTMACGSCVAKLDEPYVESKKEFLYAFRNECRFLPDGRAVYYKWIDPTLSKEERKKQADELKKHESAIKLPMRKEDCMVGMKVRSTGTASPLYEITAITDRGINVVLIDERGVRGREYLNNPANILIPNIIWQAHKEQHEKALVPLNELLDAIQEAVKRNRQLPPAMPYYQMDNPNTRRRAA